jgi:hypothetical protein
MSMPNTQPVQKTPLDTRNVFRGLAAGTITAVAFGVGGYALLFDKSTGAMGIVLFFLLPFATGFATALVARSRNLIVASLLAGLVICSGILIAIGAEGWVCVLMSAPIIAVGLTTGAVFGALTRQHYASNSTKPEIMSLLLLLILPLFLMGANSVEEPSRSTTRAETVTGVLVVDVAPETVWNEIKTMDRVTARKGLLMTIGLPVPVSCTMQGEGVGAKRTCFFESGYIEERITEWNPPHSMKMEITASDVPGRPWLTFKDASYEIKRENDRTVVTRKTTIVSRLSPAWYWRPLEKIGVDTEHEYLFEAINNNINRRK